MLAEVKKSQSILSKNLCVCTDQIADQQQMIDDKIQKIGKLEDMLNLANERIKHTESMKDGFKELCEGFKQNQKDYDSNIVRQEDEIEKKDAEIKELTRIKNMNEQTIEELKGELIVMESRFDD